MKLKVETLRGAFSVVDHVQPLQVLESSQFVRLRRENGVLELALTGSLRAEARAPFEGDGKWTFYLDRRALKAFLATTSAAEVDISLKDGSLILSAGQRLEAAKRAPVSGYESWIPKSTFALSDEQVAALSVAAKYLPNVAGMENVGAVKFESGRMVATDTVSLVSFDLPCLAEFFFPLEVAQVYLSAKGKLGADSKGVGVKLSDGFVYQPLDGALSKFPADLCRETLAAGAKSPAKFRTSAAALFDALRVASEFLLDKTEVATVEPSKTGISVSVDTGSGKFQRNVKVENCKGFEPAKWAVRRVLPWLEHAGKQPNDLELEFARANEYSASVLRWVGKQKSVFLVADV